MPLQQLARQSNNQKWEPWPLRTKVFYIHLTVPQFASDNGRLCKHLLSLYRFMQLLKYL